MAQTAINVALAVRYLRAKLYSIAIVEALCDETGGQVPLDYFMGGFPAPGQPAPSRVEHHLPRLERGAGAGQGDLARVGRTRPDHRHGAS